MDNNIYDRQGKLIGHKTTLQPSGEVVVVYPQRLRDNAERVGLNMWRVKANSGSGFGKDFEGF